MTSYPPTPSSREEYYYVTPSADPAKKKRVRPIAIVEEDELLVKIKAAALNPCDIQIANWWIWRWTNTRGFKGLGEDYSGVVKQAGARALTTHPHLTPGTPVFGLHFAPGAPDGTLSTHLTVKPAAHPCILPLPTDRLSFVEAASIPLVWLTAYTSLVEYGLLDRSPTASNARRSVVVVGASGGTGAYGVQIAKRLLGVGRVVGVCSGANEAFVRSLGADDVVAYDREDVVEGLKRRRPEGGFDVVVDNVGGTDVWQAIGQLTSADGGGFVTIVGDKTDRSSMGGSWTNRVNPIQPLRQWLGWLGLGWRYHCINLTPTEANFAPVLQLLDKGTLEVPVDSVFGFDQDSVRRAFERLDTGRAKGKVVVQVSANDA